ncbi:hypothetical protein Tco_0427173, partial [Tanacetum coccineum]
MAEIGCNWARIGPSKSSQSLSIVHTNGLLKLIEGPFGLHSLHSLCQLHTNRLLKLIEGPFGFHSLHNYTIGLSRPIRWVEIASN